MSSFAATLLTMSSSLPERCTPTSPFLTEISTTFQVCIPTPLALVSTTLGIMSVLAWLFAQMPQIYKNYQIQSTAGLSMFFVIEWFLGDLTGLLGALLTRQAKWQIVVGGYFVFVDICLVSQYLWYSHLKPRIKGHSLHGSDDDDSDDLDDDSIDGLSPINSHFRDEAFEPPLMSKTSQAKDAEASSGTEIQAYSKSDHEKASAETVPVPHAQGCSSSWLASPSSRMLLSASTTYALLSPTAAFPLPIPALSSFASSPIHPFPGSSSSSSSTITATTAPPILIAGSILAWASTFLYLLSRFPQVYKNFSRKSTAGLSPLLFIAAFGGNFFYSTSLLTNPNGWYDSPPHGYHGWVDDVGSIRRHWIRRALPFWLGSAGALFMDGLVGCQFLMYAHRGEEKVVKVRDAHGRHGRWRRVSGWMRGWIPSVRGKEKVVALDESQRLLAAGGSTREMESSGSSSGRWYRSL